MAFRTKQRSDLVGDCLLNGPCTGAVIKVRYIPAAQNRDLARRAVVRGEFDACKYHQQYGKATIAGWENFTKDMVDSLVEWDEGSDSIPVGEDGKSVTFSPELAGVLYADAPAEQFRVHIERVSTELLKEHAVEKKRGSADSNV